MLARRGGIGPSTRGQTLAISKAGMLRSNIARPMVISTDYRCWPHGVSIAKLHKLRKTTNGRTGAPYFKLLSSKRLRSKFKLSLREQVLNWLKDENPKYRTPLSTKQLS